MTPVSTRVKSEIMKRLSPILLSAPLRSRADSGRKMMIRARPSGAWTGHPLSLNECDGLGPPVLAHGPEVS